MLAMPANTAMRMFLMEMAESELLVVKVVTLLRNKYASTPSYL